MRADGRGEGKETKKKGNIPIGMTLLRRFKNLMIYACKLFLLVGLLLTCCAGLSTHFSELSIRVTINTYLKREEIKSGGLVNLLIFMINRDII